MQVDTAFFTGNFSPKVSFYGTNLTCAGDAKSTSALSTLDTLRTSSVAQRPEFGRMGLCASPEEFAAVEQLQSDQWKVLVPLTPLGAGYEATRRTVFQINPAASTGDSSNSQVVSHIRVNMGPDGGIARIRVYGEVIVSPSVFLSNTGEC